jgi:hypothetical protein
MKAPFADRAGSSTCTTRIPSPGVSAPVPPALLILIVVALGPTFVPSTTNVSERVAATPPSLSTVSSNSVPPVKKAPPPPVPGVDPPRPPVIINTSPGPG